MRRPCRGYCVTRTSGRLCSSYVQSGMESMREAQGKFLEQLLGDTIHVLAERVQIVDRISESWVGNFGSIPEYGGQGGS